jgi:14-3-3 protein epsilon
MQLLRDNLTLWTSSDNGEPEGAADAPKEEKPVEKEADGKADEPAPEQQ